MVSLITTAIWVAVTGFFVSRIDMNKVLMRFFRDLARSKARKRLYGNQHALIPMLLGREEMILNKTDDDRYAEDALTMTAEELAQYNGEDDTPLYICITGRIYDVSAGYKFYGPDGNYHQFVGKDATRAFGTGCTAEECVSSSTEGFGEAELKEVDRWLELYETHDKYTFVGFLVEDPVEKVIKEHEHDGEHQEEDVQELDEEQETTTAEENEAPQQEVSDEDPKETIEADAAYPYN